MTFLFRTGHPDTSKAMNAMRSNLLLILHNKQEQDVLSQSLQPAYNVFVAGSKEETDQIFNVVSVQLIICGITLTSPDGWEFCKQIKWSAAYSHIPIILMANDDSLPAKIKSLEAGADALIGTRVHPEYLKALVNNLIVNRIKVVKHIMNTGLVSRQDPELIADDDFMKKVNDQIDCHLPDRCLSVDLLAKLMNMSRPTLYRKIKTITDLTPNDLIQVARLKRAAQLLAADKYKFKWGTGSVTRYSRLAPFEQ